MARSNNSGRRVIEVFHQRARALAGGPRSRPAGRPDGLEVSYVQRDDSGEHGTLYYIDLATGKPAVLVSSEKLSSLAPPTSSIKDERQKEATQRYSVAAYHWSPDSKHLLFDSLGQLWYTAWRMGPPFR